MDISETFKKITEELNEKEQLVLKSMISGDTIEGTAKKLNIPKTHASSYRSTIYEIVGQYTDLGHGQNKQTALMNFMAGYESEINDRKEKVVEDLIKRNAELEKKNNCLNIELDSLRKFKEKVMADKANYFVYNPYKDKPNKIYKTYSEAYMDAKSVAKISQKPVFVLRIDTLVVPQCSFKSYDVTAEGISDKYLNQFNSTLFDQKGELIEEDEIPF